MRVKEVYGRRKAVVSSPQAFKARDRWRSLQRRCYGKLTELHKSQQRTAIDTAINRSFCATRPATVHVDLLKTFNQSLCLIALNSIF